MSSSITLDLITFDPGHTTGDADAYVTNILQTITEAWESGADLVVLPEFTWLGLEPLLPNEGGAPLQRVAQFFIEKVCPRILEELARPGKAAVLGTVSAWGGGSGQLRNRAWIINAGRLLYQDKLHLTPWERDFSPGTELLLWQFSGFRIATVICLDIEIPELSSRLRDRGVDLILCPSATETILGVERVNRCASARSVELGCYIGVSHLTGKAASDLIDENIGRAAFYRPSQAVFQKELRVEETTTVTGGSEKLRVKLSMQPLEVMRRMKAETNPSQLSKKIAGIEREIPLKLDSHP